VIEFKVWAPSAQTVELVTSGGRHSLQSGDGGWWILQHPAGGPGTDYRFSVDGGEAVPDPRSPWQPEGIDGPSRAVDHSSFAWTDAGWQPPALQDGVLYEMHVGTFSPEGTFDGVRSRLDHLVALGVTHVELLPVAEFSGDRGWGYDGVNLFAPKASYGGPEALKRLVDECHRRGLAVLLDVVYNHLGPVGNHLEKFGPYFTGRYTTPWGKAVNLDDAGSDEVRRFFIDNALGWLRDYHLDGLRLDAVHALFDQSAVHFLEELAAEVDGLERRLGRPLVLIAESDLNDPRVVTDTARGGYGLDAQWSDDFHHALHAFVTGEKDGYYADFGALADVARALSNVFVYDGCHSRHRKRRHGRPVGELPRTRFLGYLQNHDQVGNRARGERTSHLVGPAELRAAAALVVLSPFVPMLFHGEEWGTQSPFQYFTDHKDEGLAEAVRSGRRDEFAAFGWDPEEIPDPQDEETFRRSKLAWDETSREPHRTLLDWHRKLIALRRSQPSLRDGAAPARVTFDEEARWLEMERGDVTVICHFGRQRAAVPIDPGRPREVLASCTRPELQARQVEMDPGALVLGRRSA
jgi:maltooligosyltrehalose trehalohydrolase